ncbi:MAG: alkaline phosphatase D family protein [Burkholderiaceae bacterium]|nr:alkaline phosphatase D family protein [Burkholderiaceae bacterium]
MLRLCDAATPVPRRGFLRQATHLAAATALPRWAWSQTRLRHDPFGLGVASGDPTPDGVVLWTRLLPEDPLQALSPQTVHWELADDPGFRRIVRRGQASAEPHWGHSVHVELTGLAPDRWYHYRFWHGDAVSTPGRTRTAPADDAMPAAVRIAFASCQRWEHGHYAAWRHVAADHPDLVLFLGDYLYEYASPKDSSGLARTHPLRHASTLADFRDRYALYKSDPQLQAAHASCPWAVVWDDHEVQNDYAGALGRGDPTHFLALRSAAWQAFYENMPLRASSLEASGFHSLQLYRRLRWGRLAHLHLLDSRQYRSRQACRPSDSSSAPAVRPQDCGALSEAQRSLLGPAQEHWLGAGLAADARPGATVWTVLAQQTLFSPRRYPSGVVSSDSWDGYPAARSRLLQAIAGHAPRNTVLLGGDIHQNYVCQVRAAGAPPDTASPGAVIASEFCGTSLTSRSGSTQAQVDAIVRQNPHVLLARCEQRGYGLADLTPQRWTTHLRVLDDPLQEDSSARTLARFVVEEGRPGPVLDGAESQNR